MAICTAILGLGLATASAAAAASPGVWRPYGNTNPITSSPSNWYCNRSVAIAVNVVAQTCGIRTANRVFVQAAVIVRNNKPVTYITSATTHLENYLSGAVLGEWYCAQSGVAANSWSVCFGSSFGDNGGIVDAYGSANGTSLGWSGPF